MAFICEGILNRHQPLKNISALEWLYKNETMRLKKKTKTTQCDKKKIFMNNFKITL